MELNELKELWLDHNRKEEDNLRVNRRLLKEVTVRRFRSFLSEFTFENIFELVIYGVFIIFLAGFLVDHLGEPRYLIPALILLVLSLANVIFNSYCLAFLSTVNYATPLIELQRRVERIRLYQRWERNLIFILIPMFMIPFGIVVGKGVFGVDMYVFLTPEYFRYIIPGCLGGSLIVFFIMRYDRTLQHISAFLEDIRKEEKNA